MKTMVFFAVAVMTLALPSVSAATTGALPVPEPTSALLLLMGGAGAAAYRKYRGPRQ